MRIRIVALIVLMIPLLLTGCFSDKEPVIDSDSESSSIETLEIEITIENALNCDIEEIWIDPSDDPWSENRIDNNLEIGDEFTFIINEEDYYDIQVIDKEGESYTFIHLEITEDGLNLSVTEEDSDWHPPSEEITVVIENNLYNESIWYCYCTSTSSEDWGSDKLDYMVLEPNDSFEFTVPSGDYYDFYARNDHGDFYFNWEVYIERDEYTWAISSTDLDNTIYFDETHGETAPITFINRLGSIPITLAFGDVSGGEYWGDNLLFNTIEPTEDFTFHVEADKFYDFQVEDESGNTYTMWEVAVKDNGIFWEIIPDDMDE